MGGSPSGSTAALPARLVLGRDPGQRTHLVFDSGVKWNIETSSHNLGTTVTTIWPPLGPGENSLQSDLGTLGTRG